MRHDIKPKIQSTSSNCVQTSTSQFLGHYGVEVSPAEIEESVPVRVNSDGQPMGTLFADIGRYIQSSHNRDTSMYVFDSQIIDRSWKDLDQTKIKAHLGLLLESGVKTAKTPYADLHIEAYNQYLAAGGRIEIEKCTNTLLHTLLDKGPVLAIISFNYMYDYARCSYDETTKSYVPDPVNGKVIEHAVLLTGYTDSTYTYNDPDAEMGGQHEVGSDVMIGAICSAQINSDNYLLVIN